MVLGSHVGLSGLGVCASDQKLAGLNPMVGKVIVSHLTPTSTLGSPDKRLTLSFVYVPFSLERDFGWEKPKHSYVLV